MRQFASSCVVVARNAQRYPRRARRNPKSASSVTLWASHAPRDSRALRRKNTVVPPRGIGNPSFSIYTELAMSAADRLIIPFSADGSSKRAVKSVMSLVYGIQRRPGQAQSEFFLNSNQHRMSLPLIYTYVGNRLTQMNNSSASAFKNVVTQIFNEVFVVWQNQPQRFCPHPTGGLAPTSKRGFRLMFEEQINDANTASVVSGAMGIPINRLTAGQKSFAGRTVTVNQSQLDRQQPNIRSFVAKIE